MAVISVPASRNRSQSPLTVTRGALDRRWIMLTEAVRQEIGLDRDAVVIHPEYVGDGVWAGFVGRACETVERQRGRATPVAPLSEIGGDGLKAWLGFQEVWDAQPTGQRFNFRHLSLTVHCGYGGDPVKPQIFRSEWSGIKSWPGSGLGFQSPGAGHPHWQFDVAESLRSTPGPREESLLQLSEPTVRVEEFPPAMAQIDVISAVRALTLERMHFASAAPWWDVPNEAGAPSHMNAPSDEEGLFRWTLRCIGYIRQELTRCELQL
jgi:hypothetical protein